MNAEHVYKMVQEGKMSLNEFLAWVKQAEDEAIEQEQSEHNNFFAAQKPIQL